MYIRITAKFDARHHDGGYSAPGYNCWHYFILINGYIWHEVAVNHANHQEMHKKLTEALDILGLEYEADPPCEKQDETKI